LGCKTLMNVIMFKEIIDEMISAFSSQAFGSNSQGGINIQAFGVGLMLLIAAVVLYMEKR